MTDRAKEADRQCMEAYGKVVDHFKGDTRKANDWFGKVNPNLKSSPMNMIGSGRAAELNRYIDRHTRGKR